MYSEYDEEAEIYDIFYTNDLCQDCVNENKCSLIKALQFGMVTLSNSQPLEYCDMFQKITFIDWLFRRKE